jgi:alpha-1,2-mannosyltransferase
VSKPPQPKVSAKNLVIPLILGFAVLMGGVDWIGLIGNFNFADFTVYVFSEKILLAGGDPYGPDVQAITGMHFIYPPIAGLLMAPFAAIMTPAQNWFGVVPFVVVPLSVLVVVLHWDWIVRQRTRIAKIGVAFALIVAVLLASPSVENVYVGQISALIGALFIVDVAMPTSWRRKLHLPQGVLIGFAGALKLIPMIMVPYWLLTKQWKPAVTSTVTFLSTWLLAWIIYPPLTASYWAHGGLGLASSINNDFGSLGNQGLSGIIFRTFGLHTPTSLIYAGIAIVGALCMWLAVKAHKVGAELAAASLIGAAAFLCTPVSWVHYAVYLFLIPAAVLASSHRHHNLIAAAYFALLCVQPAHYPISVWGLLGIPLHDWTNTLGILGIILVAIVTFHKKDQTHVIR